MVGCKLPRMANMANHDALVARSGEKEAPSFPNAAATGLFLFVFEFHGSGPVLVSGKGIQGAEIPQWVLPFFVEDQKVFFPFTSIPHVEIPAISG